jgi:hypothetical protein
LPEEARRVAGKLLPDLLRYDPTRPASFPDNGRALTDDVQDAFLAVLTNGKVTEDKVGPTAICSLSSRIWGHRTTPEDSQEGGQTSLCVNGWPLDFAKFFSRKCHVALAARAMLTDAVSVVPVSGR